MSGITQSPPIGVGQTWQNVTASRAINTTYTNTTGKPILVNITSALLVSTNTLITVDGVLVSSAAYNSTTVGATFSSAIVPNNSTYSVASVAAIQLWAELR
jgi:hypothetical protein